MILDKGNRRVGTDRSHDGEEVHLLAVERKGGVNLLADNASDGNRGANNHGDPSSGGRSLSPIKAAYDDGARPSKKNSPGGSHEEEDVFGLLEEEAETEGENGYARHGEPEGEHVSARG